MSMIYQLDLSPAQAQADPLLGFGGNWSFLSEPGMMDKINEAIYGNFAPEPMAPTMDPYAIFAPPMVPHPPALVQGWTQAGFDNSVAMSGWDALPGVDAVNDYAAQAREAQDLAAFNALYRPPVPRAAPMAAFGLENDKENAAQSTMGLQSKQHGKKKGQHKKNRRHVPVLMRHVTLSENTEGVCEIDGCTWSGSQADCVGHLRAEHPEYAITDARQSCPRECCRYKLNQDPIKNYARHYREHWSDRARCKYCESTISRVVDNNIQRHLRLCSRVPPEILKEFNGPQQPHPTAPTPMAAPAYEPTHAPIAGPSSSRKPSPTTRAPVASSSRKPLSATNAPVAGPSSARKSSSAAYAQVAGPSSSAARAPTASPSSSKPTAAVSSASPVKKPSSASTTSRSPVSKATPRKKRSRDEDDDAEYTPSPRKRKLGHHN